MHIVLIEPDIPQNTGNISRLCVGLNATLHLVHPMGFKLDDKRLKRAGLDYWPHLHLIEHKNWQEFASFAKTGRLYSFTTKGTKLYTTISYTQNDYLIFGSESCGFSPEFRASAIYDPYLVPMPGLVRSLNLSNAVAVVAYEVYRQGNS